MTSLWEWFKERAPDREVAGYFERFPQGSERQGVAVAFERPERVVALSRRTDPAEFFRDIEHRLTTPRSAVMGYFGFDAVGLFEPALASFPSGSPFPLGEFAVVRQARVSPVLPAARRPFHGRPPHGPLADSLSAPKFGRAVRSLVEAIREGEAFQVVLAHRREWNRPSDLLERASRLRSTENYAFFYYLKFGDREVVGATPECVIEVRGGQAFINPIAGTLPTTRGGARGRLPLRNDPKELAEHRMLVDLARNDLGAVSRPGTVHLVWEERRIRYARLEHLVSRVAGRLAPHAGAGRAFAAAFPAGTVSGAPKIRATELLRKEESTWRGPYGGAVALFRPHGQADFALTIRSGFASGARLYTAAGAGIVHRSKPAREFHETLTKLAHTEAALVGTDE